MAPSSPPSPSKTPLTSPVSVLMKIMGGGYSLAATVVISFSLTSQLASSKGSTSLSIYSGSLDGRIRCMEETSGVLEFITQQSKPLATTVASPL
jgi:hypothetical protein